MAPTERPYAEPMKNTNTSRILLASTLAATMALGGVAFAQPGPGGGGGMCMGGDCMGGGGGRGGGRGMRGGGGMMNPAGKLLRLMGTLDLTEAQEVALVRLRREMREFRQANDPIRQAEQKTLAAELAKPNPSAAVLTDLLDKRLDRQKAHGRILIDKVLKFHATLSAEQKQVLAERLTQMQDRMQQRGKRGGAKNR